MKDLGPLPTLMHTDYKDRVNRLFRLIHTRSAKSIFGLGGTLVMLPALAEAQDSPVQILIEDVTSIREYELRADGTIRAVLTNGQKVLITDNNIFIDADGTIRISELAAEELLLASDSAYGMVGISTNEALLEGATSIFGVTQFLSTGGLLSKTLKVLDAPLEGAMVFYDGKTTLDGIPEESEYLGLTDENGAVTFDYEPVARGMFLVVPVQNANGTEFGWSDDFINQFDGVVTRDVVTDNSFSQVLQAADTQEASGQIVSPLTTLVETLADADGISSAEAASKVKSALGIDDAVDLDSFDFVAALESEDADTAETAQAVLAAATIVAKIVDTALTAAGTEENIDGVELADVSSDAMAAVAQTLAEISDAKDADAGFAPTIEDVATLATAVAVAQSLVEEVDDAAAEAMAENAVAGMVGGDDADAAATAAIASNADVGDDAATAAAELGQTLGDFAGEVEDLFDNLDEDGLTADVADELDQTLEDTLANQVAEIVNETILGISLVEDEASGVEHQTAPIKGNLLANDAFANGEGLTSTTVLYSVEGSLVTGQATTADTGSYLISTADWGTETPTVVASSLLAGLADGADTVAALPSARTTGGAATKGSAIYTTLTVSQADIDAGEATFGFDYTFGSYDYLPYNDYSFVAIHATNGGTAAEQDGTVLAGETDGPADVQDLKGDTWYTLMGEYADTDTAAGSPADGSFSYTFTEAGTFQIAIGVTDVRDTIFDSFISVESVDYQVAGTSSATQPSFDAQDFRGNVQANTANDGTVTALLVTGSYGQLVVTETGDYIYQVGEGANVEDIAAGDTVTENFKYTVQLDDGRLATSRLNIRLDGVEEQVVSLQFEASNINAEVAETYEIAGTLSGANVGDQIEVTVTGSGIAPSTVTLTLTADDITDGTAFWSSGGMDTSGLDDGSVTVTASLVGTDVSTSVTNVTKDTTADTDDNFTITYSVLPTAPDEDLEFTISGLDSDTTATLYFSDGSGADYDPVEMLIDANTADLDGTPNYALTLPDGWDTTAEISVSVDISDDNGNQMLDGDLPGFFAPTFAASVNDDGEINAADLTATSVSLSTSAPAGTNPQLVSLSFSDGTNTVDVTSGLPLALSGGTGSLSGLDLTGLADGSISMTAVMEATLADSSTASVTSIGSATLDTTADAGNDLAASLTDDIDDSSDTQVTVDLSGLDDDASTATIVFSDGTTTLDAVLFDGATATVDLTGLAAGVQITSQITVTDTFGNTAVVDGPVTSLGDLPTVSLDPHDPISDADKTTVVITGTTTNATVDGEVTVTISDGVNTDVVDVATVLANGTYSVTVDVSALDDGALDITAALEATVGGATQTGAPATAQVTLDTTAEAGGDTAAASLSDDISGEGDTFVTLQLDLATLDADVAPEDATVVFTDGTTTLGDVSFDSAGAATVDLAGLIPNQDLTSVITLMDALGNTHSFDGPSPALVQLPQLSLDDLGIINAAGASAVAVSGQTDLTAGTVDIILSDDVDNAETGQAIIESDGSFSFGPLDVSELNDGTLTITATATGTIGGGVVTSAEVTDDRELDTTADVGADITTSLSDDLDGLHDTEVTVQIDSGLDADVDPTAVSITFGDGTTTTSPESFDATGAVTVDLSGLDSSQPITSTLTITDAAGNTTTAAGPGVSFNTAAIYNATQDVSYTAEQLQLAVTEASSGDVIELGAGDITGDVTIDKSLTLKGVHNGTPAADASDPSGMDPEGRGGESNLTGTLTVAAANVVIDGVKLDNDAPLTWDESILTGDANSGFGNELDGFQLLNSVMTTYTQAGAPVFGPSNATYAGPTMASSWEISGNLIGGVTEGNSGTLYLAGLEDSSISGNVFWRPTAGHLYLSSTTNVAVDGNFFYHGVHANGIDLDGLGSQTSGAGYEGYGYGNISGAGDAQDQFLGRNFWIEVKGTNTDLSITGNDGQYNSGGIQLYGESGDETFDGVTISGNTFRDFVNADPGGALVSGVSGFMGAIAVSTLASGSQISDLTIADNDITMAVDQIFDQDDLPATIYVNGSATDSADVDGESVTMTGNTITITDTSASEILAAQSTTSSYTGVFQAVLLGSGIEDDLRITGNTLNDTSSGNVAGITMISDGTDSGLAPLTADTAVTGNTITGFENASFVDQILVYGMDLSQQLDDLNLQSPATLVVTSDTPVLYELKTGTTGDDSFVGSADNDVFVTRGGQDTADLSAGGTDIVAIDGRGSDGDLVTLTDFTTGDVADADGIALYNLIQSDLRGDGDELQHVTADNAVNANTGILVFTNEIDLSGGAAAAIETAVEGLSGLAAGDIVFAVAGTGTDAALVRVEMSASDAGTATQLASLTLAAGTDVEDIGSENFMNDVQILPVF
jgi:hypothetical protein